MTEGLPAGTPTSQPAVLLSFYPKKTPNPTQNVYRSTADVMTFPTQISLALKSRSSPGNLTALYFPAVMLL